MSTETVAALIGNVALALSLVVALVFGVAQLRASDRDRRETAAIATVRQMQTREMAEHFARLGTLEFPKTLDEVVKLPEDLRISIIHYAQQMEMLGLMVYEGLISVSLVERTLGDYVSRSWAQYKPFSIDGRKSDPYLNEYFEWLARTLEEYMRTNPRPPAYTTLPDNQQS
jgi:hypothetical protein